MASGVSRVVSGEYTGTGAALDVIDDKVGFKPKKVEIHCLTTTIDKAEHLDGMADASFLLTTGSTGVRTLVSAAGITLEDSGFSVGTAATINTLGSVYKYVCWE